jgi:ubiquinone/menaquinone biosynthesis C-methylase UbiE
MIDNPVRGSFNAWLLGALDGYMHAKYGEAKTRLFKGAPPVVLEIGPGSGANMRYYAPGTRIIAIEPNVRMHERLRQRAKKLGVTLDIHPVGAERLDIPSHSVDLACATLVLCSVANPAAVVAEMRRVLRPGGRFVLIEHVMAPSGSLIALLQRTIRKPWQWVFEGCNLCNNTPSILEQAGFQHVEIEPLAVRTVLLPIRYQVIASCTR